MAALGIANQRETVVLWERESGRPLANAIVWQDTRSAERVAGLGDVDRFREQTGLPLATYFSGPKLSWLLDSLPGARARAEAGELAAGTIDSWLAWQLAGVHVTDVTNASRTLLMDLRTLDWDDGLLDEIGVPRPMLAQIVPSSVCWARSAASRSLRCSATSSGALRAMLLRPRRGQVHLRHRQLPRAEHRRARSAVASRAHHGRRLPAGWRGPVFMLEGSIAVTGALVQWLRDNLGLIERAADSEALAATVPDSDGCVIVPAFSGLFAPRWRSDARGVICGLTRFHTKAHIARAALDATAYATRELVEAMAADAGVALPALRVDGGMTANGLLMQIQADTLGLPVVRPAVIETTALGAAYAAGLAVGFWQSQEELRGIARGDTRWTPRASEDERARGYAAWNAAVERSLGWV